METNLDERIKILYNTFSINPKPDKSSFCTHCYDVGEIDLLSLVSPKKLNSDLARRLLWDLHHHDLGAVKYFFPRLLEIMSPPHHLNPLSYKQFFKDLSIHNFFLWDTNQINSVLSFFDSFTAYKRLQLEATLEEFNGKKQTYEEALADFSVPNYCIEEEDWLKWNESFGNFIKSNPQL